MQTYGRRCMPLSIALLALAMPSPAVGAVQLGETFAPTYSDLQTTLLQSSSPGGQYTAPSAGVITAWSHQAHATGRPIRFKVARPAGGNKFTIVGQSPLKTPLAGQLNTYTDIAVPVQAGDVLGIYADAPDVFIARDGVASTYTMHILAGDHQPGTTPTFSPFMGYQLDVSARLEPDCDSDGLGDETQDADTSSCNPLPEPLAGRTLTLDANKNKVTRGKKVRLSGQVNQLARQGQCESNQPVQLQRKRPSQATFTTVEQLQTDATGSFSTRKKVKKTFEYRAQMAEAGGCASGLSNTEKVKVKKKK
jgi:hypothetical protein